MSRRLLTRRGAFADLGGRIGDVLGAQRQAITAPPRALTPLNDLVNLLEFEEMARITLDAEAYEAIAGSDREAFNRMSLRPRMLVDSSTLDLTTELFGERMFAPILVGPTAEQQRFHPDGELATVRGASEAKTTVVVSSRSSYTLEQIARQGRTTFWYQVSGNQERGILQTQIQQAVEAGCRAVSITVDVPRPDRGTVANPAGHNWRLIESVSTGIGQPVLLKGVMTPDDARRAVEMGMMSPPKLLLAGSRPSWDWKKLR